MDDSESTKKVSRRSFLKTAGGTALGSTLLASLPPAVKDSFAEETNDELSPGTVPLTFRVNGERKWLKVDPRDTLLHVLRNQIGLTGTKMTCNRGQCGACTVLLDGEAVYSCHMLALDAEGRDVTTVEGLLAGEALHPIQQAFVDHDGLQCGFCTSGQIMAAQGLLNRYPNPTRDQVLEGMSGNLCRCSAYPNILKSVLSMAK